MRALSMSKSAGGNTLSIIKMPIPKATPGNVIVRIHASSINPSDILNAKGGFPYTTYPRVPGRDFSGIVVDGPAQSIGRDVFGTSGRFISFEQDGAHAEYCLVPEDAVVDRPITLSFVQAATVGVPFTTAAICLDRGRVRKTDVVLVIGANGSVGNAAVQQARSRGCRVITAARGSDADVDVLSDADMGTARKYTKEGKGVDVVIDTTGDPQILDAALKLLAHGGRLVFIAAPRSGSTDFTFDLKNLYRNEQEIIGCNSLSYSAAELATVLQAMQQLFEEDELKAPAEEQLVVMDLDTALEVYENPKKFGKSKAVIVFSGF